MNHRTLFYLAVLGLFALLGWSSGQLLVPRATNADEPPPSDKSASKPCEIAVMDVGKIFKEHIEFKKAMDLLKLEMETFQTRVRAEQEELQKRIEYAKTLKAGSEPRLQEEAKLVRRGTELQREGTDKQEQLMKTEARVYHDIYKHLVEQTNHYAKAKGFKVVLRYNSEPINPDDRNSVLSGVNNAIIFQDGIDITAEMIRRVNNLPEKS